MILWQTWGYKLMEIEKEQVERFSCMPISVKYKKKKPEGLKEQFLWGL